MCVVGGGVVVVAAFYFFPALNLSVRVLIHFFLFLCPAKVGREIG